MSSLRLPRRLRFRIALLLMGCLAFQQMAAAAYACTVSQMSVATMPGMTDCKDMAMPVPQPPTLCEKHCHPDASTLTDAKLLHVPPLALPALGFATSWSIPANSVQHYRDVPVYRSDPPPTLRFCSLLI